MRIWITLTLSLSWAWFGGPLAAQAPDPQALLARADEQRSLPDLSFVLTLTASEGGQEAERSTLWGWVKTGPGGSKALLAFTEPAASRGRKMLMDGPSVYLLFPKTRNPLRLSPLQVLVGQSSNGDVARTGFSLDYDVVDLGSEDRDQRPCWVFHLRAKAQRTNTYRAVTLWVDQQSLRLVAADFFTNGDQVLKHTEYGDYRSVAGKAVPFRLTITDGADPTKKTVMQYEKLGTRALPASMYRKDYLEAWTPEEPR